MIRVRIEMLPFGAEPAAEIASFEIANLCDHAEAPHFANYEVRGRHNNYGSHVEQLYFVENHRREDCIFRLLERVCQEWRSA